MARSDMIDSRFIVAHGGDPEFSLVTRSSDGQMLFLANKLAKMKRTPPAAGSRRSTTDRRSSRATPGRARATSGSGSSRTTGSRPSSPFRSTSSTTPASRRTSGCCPTASPSTARGKVQLIDASVVVQAAAQESRPEELRPRAGRRRAHRAVVSGLRAGRAFAHLPQRALRLLEGDGGASAPAAQPDDEEERRVAPVRHRRRGRAARGCTPSSGRTCTTGSRRSRRT